MPFKNQWAARQKEPGQFKKYTRTNNKFGKGIHAVWGIKGGKAHLQTIRFDKSKFSKKTAAAWAKKHGHKSQIECLIKEADELLARLKRA